MIPSQPQRSDAHGLRDAGSSELAVVVVAHQMGRELPRTLESLARTYQRGVASIDYEVVVVDNGSDPAVPDSLRKTFCGKLRVLRIDNAPPSPARACNLGVRATDSRYVGVILDGARMVTPGAIAKLLGAAKSRRRAIATLLAWHLGPDHQSRSMQRGYGPEEEDRLLASIRWPSDGYRLFTVGSLAGANPDGFFGAVSESCFFIIERALWEEVGGLDERFDLPGGGLVSPDLFSRLSGLAETQVTVVLGEGSFHQVHGGASTKPGVDLTPWMEQYERLRGHPYAPPDYVPEYFGRLGRYSRRFAGAGGRYREGWSRSLHLFRGRPVRWRRPTP